MEVLSSRVLLPTPDPDRLVAFYRDRIGLAIAREYPGGVVFHAGNGFIEIPAHIGATGTPGDALLWLQVRELTAAERHLRDAGVAIVREPRTEPWGLREMHIDDPDGRRLIVVEVPDDHPLRKDLR